MRGGLKRFEVPARAIAIASAVLTLSAGLACGRPAESRKLTVVAK